ncbi:MAG: acetoin utilization protein AcuC [Rhodobacteraceae bacterium]|nr:acetoin utilization protein AcuC [Paracoccaceae bacterium]
MAVFLGSEIYRGSSYGDWHPLSIPRVPTVIDLSRALGWLPPERYRTSPRAKAAALAAWHEPAYLDALQRAEETQQLSAEEEKQFALGTTMNPYFGEMFRRPATGCGGSLLAAELLADGGIVFHPGGGTHHGMPGYASGFCYLNDCVLSILALQRVGARRVAYLDIDAHHPDGVAHAFRDDPSVLILSVHEENRWPRTGLATDRGPGTHINIPVAPGFTDADLARIREEVAIPAVRDFRPDAIVLQCGADAVAGDPQSRLTLTNNAHVAWVRTFVTLAPRILITGGGGYNPWTVGRLWTALWGVASGQELPETLPPAAQSVLEGLSWKRAGKLRAPDVEWTKTLLDPIDSAQ